MLRDVARGAEELVCVLVLRGSCEKKERRRRDGVVEIIFLIPQRHLTTVSRVPCVNTIAAVFKLRNIVWLSGSVLGMNRQLVVSSWLTGWLTLKFAQLSSYCLASAVASRLQQMSVNKGILKVRPLSGL